MDQDEYSTGLTEINNRFIKRRNKLVLGARVAFVGGLSLTAVGFVGEIRQDKATQRLAQSSDMVGIYVNAIETLYDLNRLRASLTIDGITYDVSYNSGELNPFLDRHFDGSCDPAVMDTLDAKIQDVERDMVELENHADVQKYIEPANFSKFQFGGLGLAILGLIGGAIGSLYSERKELKEVKELGVSCKGGPYTIR